MAGVHDAHRERMRRRVDEHGFETLLEHEQLEYLLFFSIPRGDVNPLAHALIKEFKSLSGVREAPREELLKIDGVGEKTARLLTSICPVLRAYHRSVLNASPQIVNTRAAIDVARSLYTGVTTEQLYLLCLDVQCHLKKAVLLREGTVDEVPVYPREVAEQVLRADAKYVILVHNHPSFSAAPSQADKALTARLQTTLRAVGVELLDHVIIANGSCYSFLQNGEICKGTDGVIYASVPEG